jgi:hypothetical protein
LEEPVAGAKGGEMGGGGRSVSVLRCFGVRCAVCGVRCAVCGVRCAVCGVRCFGEKNLQFTPAIGRLGRFTEQSLGWNTFS